MMQKKNKSIFSTFFEPVAVFFIAFLFLLLGIFGALNKLEFRFYDFLLGLSKNPQTSPELLLVEVDNDSLEALGIWPWPRNIIAGDLLKMKELNADCAVFDIEYLTPSAPALAENIDDKIYDFLQNPSSQNAASFKSSLLSDYDGFFGKSLQFFDNAWLTINTCDIGIVLSDQDRQFAYDYCLFTNVSDKNNLIEKNNSKNRTEQGEAAAKGFSPAMNRLLKFSKGAGFTNVLIDSDGTRRRIQLLEKEGDAYAGQLVFAPLLSKLNPQQIIRNKHNYVIKEASVNGQVKDIKIPVDSSGRVLINWVHDDFNKSFRHVSIARLNELDWAENNISSALLSVQDELVSRQNSPVSRNDEFSILFDKVDQLNLLYDDILAMKNQLLESCGGFNADKTAVDGGVSQMLLEQYFEVRKTFFDELSVLIKDDSPLYVISALIPDAEFFAEDCQILKEYTDKYVSSFAELKTQFDGAFCIIGNTASSTTDLGTTPFERAYPNVGTHANLYNTIMTESFVYPVHWLWGFALAVVLSASLAFISRKKKVTLLNFAGIASIILILALSVCLMMIKTIYLPAIIPLLTVLTSFIVIEILHYLKSEQDKSFLKHAFATYLNPKSVDELIKNPEKLSLGGQQKHLTALFSDVQSFSTFSESVTPVKLVEVLQTYLGNMSDCILDVGGTIDKYEGDAIISFFGAPNDLDNNAYAACASAIKMKQAEDRYNEENLATGFLPKALKTRIGINTGEMIVGNMGTDKKFNYTIMGNDVNIASRLEGVNKVYKSWILVSERTWNEANVGQYKDKIVVRPFDRVRVIGIETPIQLYNVVGFREEMSETQLKAIDVFNEAMAKYLSKDFAAAKAQFEEAASMVEGDESPLVYAERCDEYIKNGVPAGWTGIVTMKTK